ncbi:hypothetical protein ACFX2I_018408 [Malus domestica]
MLPKAAPIPCVSPLVSRFCSSCKGSVLTLVPDFPVLTSRPPFPSFLPLHVLSAFPSLRLSFHCSKLPKAATRGPARTDFSSPQLPNGSSLWLSPAASCCSL